MDLNFSIQTTKLNNATPHILYSSVTGIAICELVKSVLGWKMLTNVQMGSHVKRGRGKEYQQSKEHTIEIVTTQSCVSCKQINSQRHETQAKERERKRERDRERSGRVYERDRERQRKRARERERERARERDSIIKIKVAFYDNGTSAYPNE
jgi:hypothetical protein